MNEAEKTVADEERKRKKKALAAAYYIKNKARNRERANASSARWRANNPDKAKDSVARSTAKRNAEDPGWRIAWSASYYIKNRERIRANTKAYLANHPEISRHSENRRRELKNNSGTINDPAIKAWDKAWRGKKRVRCYWCNDLFGPGKCHADHIVALSKGGLHRIDNLCIACASCNNRKHNKDVHLWNKQLSAPVLL